MRKNSQSGFTLIEMLMVILLVAILAAVAIPQFVDFRTEARNAATNSALGAIRTGLATQVGQMIVRCNAAPGTFPTQAQVDGNDVTVGGTPCTAAMITNAAERQVTPNTIPENSWSPAAATAVQKRTVAACAGTGCNRTAAGLSCDGATAWNATNGGWCYNPATGLIWANSGNNGSATAPEYSF